MSKDAKYIGSTPHNLSRAASDMALKQFAENNKKLIENLTRIQSNIEPLQNQLLNSSKIMKNYMNLKNS